MFSKQIDEVFGSETVKSTPEDAKSAESVHVQSELTDLPENEFEPEGVVDPEEVPADPDPFAAMLDLMLKEEGVDVELEKRRKYNPTGGDVNNHEWVSQRERMFSEEPYMFRCKRCLKWVQVGSEETIAEVLQRNEIDPNCGHQVLSSIMDS
jgi:hypothetical protein